MTRNLPALRARHFSTVSYLIAGMLVLGPTAVLADPESKVSEVPISVTKITREQLDNLPASRDLRTILEMHNTARAGVGSQPLRWNPVLADGAQDYAEGQARTGSFEHSSYEARMGGNYSENLSLGPIPGMKAKDLVQIWFDEAQFFNGGNFPAICDGDWSQCGHYSQAIWSTTTDIGCGYASENYTALVCFYQPQGNLFGKPVLGVPPVIAQGPVINVNNPPQIANAQPQQPVPACQVPEPDDLVSLITQALESQYRYDSPQAGDAETDFQWKLATEREAEVQERMMRELATLQGDVAKHINAYLAATSAYQSSYSYLSSSTTGLQGLLTNWLESREIYEKADLAFGLANLGVGGVKLGFKAYKFFTKPKAASAGAEAAATLAGAVDDAAAAGQAAGGTAKAAGATAAQVAEYERRVANLTKQIEDYRSQGMKFLADSLAPNLDELVKAGPESIKILTEAERTAAAVASLDTKLVALAREAGVNVDNIATVAKDAQAGDLALMRAIAQARGWHDIPAWSEAPIQNVLLQARKMLAGVDDARISPDQLEVVKSLKTYIESKGLNFADWLRKAAGEVEDGIVGAEEATSTAIVRYFDEADVDLLLKAIDAGGDATKLRATVTPVAQASLNGLGRAAQAGAGGCGVLEADLALQGLGGTLQGAANGAGTSPSGGAVAPGGKPSDAQLANVLTGMGQLGDVGLSNIVDQFGVTDRFTAGQGYGRAVLGELWELITSPSATVASHYYTFEAQSEVLKLLENEGDKLLKLGGALDDAARALRNLQSTLQNASLTGPGSYLGNTGPRDLNQALDKLQKVYASGSDGWKASHKAEMDARRQHIQDKLAALSETVADLSALSSRMGNVIGWLDSLRKDPSGGLRGPVDVFNPQAFIRLGSISLYLRGVGADAFGLTSDVPFRMVAPQLQPASQQARPQPQKSDAEIEADFEKMRAEQAERTRAIDEVPETAVDPSIDAWLDNLPPPK